VGPKFWDRDSTNKLFNWSAGQNAILDFGFRERACLRPARFPRITSVWVSSTEFDRSASAEKHI